MFLQITKIVLFCPQASSSKYDQFTSVMSQSQAILSNYKSACDEMSECWDTWQSSKKDKAALDSFKWGYSIYVAKRSEFSEKRTEILVMGCVYHLLNYIRTNNRVEAYICKPQRAHFRLIDIFIDINILTNSIFTICRTLGGNTTN